MAKMYNKRVMDGQASRKIEEFFTQSKPRFYKKRNLILRPDESPPGIFYIKKGYVRLYSISLDGKELTLLIFRPTDIFPLIWAINNTPNAYYLEAMTPVELSAIPRDKFVEFLRENHDVFLLLTKRILFRFEAVLTRMDALVFGNAYSKVSSIFFILVERFGIKKRKNYSIPIPLTHKDIACLIGIARETASLEIEKLEDKGIIGHQGRFFIVKNLKRLRKEALFEDETNLQ